MKPHPIYLKAAKGDWIEYKDIAALIRDALKRAFAGAKFSVRTDTYAGGGSVYVKWTDGPTQSQVEAVANRYQTRRFDGMIDMAHDRSLWIYADGTVSIAHDGGTQDSGGYHAEMIESAVRPDGILCGNIAGAYVSCSRELSCAFLEAALDAFKAENYAPLENLDWSTITVVDDGWGARIKGADHIRFYDDWLNHAIYLKARKRSAPGFEANINA